MMVMCCLGSLDALPSVINLHSLHLPFLADALKQSIMFPAVCSVMSKPQFDTQFPSPALKTALCVPIDYKS